MYLFFYGESEFFLEKKLKELKTKYQKKAGGNLNLITFDGASFSAEDFITQAQTVPLLATSRLIVVKNIFSCKSKKSLDKVKEYLPKIPDSTIVVFTHIGKIDKRLGLYKTLSASKNAHEFQVIDQSKQKQYARREIERLGAKIEDDALDLLIDYCQGDVFALSHETEKLSLYKHGSTVNTKDVEGMVNQGVSSDIFVMIDRLSAGNRKGALSELERLYSNGEPGLRILAMIHYQYSLIARIKEAQEKTSNPFEASKSAGVSYFQAKKVFDISRDMSWQKLFEVYSLMLVFDEGIKTGKISEEEGIRELVLKL